VEKVEVGMRTFLMWLSLVLLTPSAGLASPTCTLPYNLQNGQTADATQVMANLNALVTCVGTAASAGANSDITSLTGLSSPLPSPGGFFNKFRNGTMDVWQRGTSVTATTSGNYTADGWILVPTGAGVTAQRTAGRQLTAYSLQVVGATGVLDVVVKQRVESVIAAPLSDQTVTVQARVYNNTTSPITPLLTVRHAGAADNWASPITDVSAVSLQSAPNGQWTQIAYTFVASTSSGNGLEISFDFGNNFSSNTYSIQITELDIRATPNVSTGINSNPPPPELRPIATELAFCQRYFETSYDLGTSPGTATTIGIQNVGFTSSGSTTAGMISFKMPKRADPTMNYYDSAGTANSTLSLYSSGFSPGHGSVGALSAGESSATMTLNQTSGNNQSVYLQFTASAEL
jgi:hypothetical protein